MNTFSQHHSKSIYNDIQETEENESYVNQYQEEHEEQNTQENEDENNLDLNFSNALERDTFENEDPEEEDPDDDFEEDLDENDLDDDLIEDYDENDREIDNYTPDQLKNESSEQVFDIDQDLEEVDPVNHPREFDF